MKYDVPFFANTPDNLQCAQAAYLSIATYFDPKLSITWDEWSKLTGFVKDKGTWATTGLLWFKNNGYDVQHISLFDYEDFATNGGNYLIREFGQEVGEWQVAHSNIAHEQLLAKSALQSGIFKKQEPTQEDIKKYLDSGYLVKCLVNSSALSNKKGYVGHTVVVVGFDDTGFIMHDPGLPPLPNRHVPYTDFEKAWAYPNKKAKELDAIKR